MHFAPTWDFDDLTSCGGRHRYWSIYEGYFALGGHGINTAKQDLPERRGGKQIDMGSESTSQATASPSSTEVQALREKLDQVAATVGDLATQQQKIIELLQASRDEAGI